jgi:PAS domain S-box-containing protein
LKLQEAVVAIGRRAISQPELSVLLQDAAQLLAEMFGAEHCGIAEVSPHDASIRWRLFLSYAEPTQRQELVYNCSAVAADSLVAYTIQEAHPVVVENLPHDKRFCDLRLQGQGIRSALAVPLMLWDRSYGALAALSKNECVFSEGDVSFAETIAHLLSVSIARLHAEQSLSDQRRAAAELLNTVDALVLTLDAEGRVLEINRVGQRVTGLSADEVRLRPIAEVISVPEEFDLFRQIFQRLRAGHSPVEYESLLLTKDSRRHRIAWSYGGVFAAGGELESVIVTGIDVTGRREAEQRAERAERCLAGTGQPASANAAGQEGISPGVAAPGVVAPGEAMASAGQTPVPPAVSGAAGSERRCRGRRPYPYEQSIAPVIDGRLPAASEFSQIRCRDIASGGFSFLSAAPPRSDTFIVALGQPPKLTHLAAQVAHVTRVEHDGRRMYLIGCNYTGRISC